MSSLDDYRSALLAAFAETLDSTLHRTLDNGGAVFATLVVGHGLGPLWHARTGREEFHESRMAAESLFMAQQLALKDIDAVLGRAKIDYVVIKGAANRLVVLDNPAIRACHDIDLLVSAEDRVRTASALVEHGYSARAKLQNMSHQLELSQGAVNIDLHWGLLREGRLRNESVADMLSHRRQVDGVWMLDAQDTLFLLLVHPAFAKHLAGWDMGLHRVADIVYWIRTQPVDWPVVLEALAANGVKTAAWATLRWVQMLAAPHELDRIDQMLVDTQPGRLRRAWLDAWLRNNWSAQTAGQHWVRLLGFSPFLHDSPRDVVRVIAGRRRAHQRSQADLAAFAPLFGE